MVWMQIIVTCTIVNSLYFLLVYLLILAFLKTFLSRLITDGPVVKYIVFDMIASVGTLCLFIQSQLPLDDFFENVFYSALLKIL